MNLKVILNSLRFFFVSRIFLWTINLCMCENPKILNWPEYQRRVAATYKWVFFTCIVSLIILTTTQYMENYNNNTQQQKKSLVFLRSSIDFHRSWTARYLLVFEINVLCHSFIYIGADVQIRGSKIQHREIGTHLHNVKWNSIFCLLQSKRWMFRLYFFETL